VDVTAYTTTPIKAFDVQASEAFCFSGVKAKEVYNPKTCGFLAENLQIPCKPKN
jgi:hypothetical protein